MDDPDFTPEVPAQEDYISSYVDEADDALFSSTFESPTTGWRACFDEAAAVNFYIVNDVMGNVDGGDFYSSGYFYRDVDNPLIYMGPVWDFDVSSGNVNYAPIVNPTIPWMQVKAPWYVGFFKDPGFKADVITQWNTLKNNGVFAAWLASIPTEAASLEQSQANNFGRWPMQGVEVWPNPEAVGSYDGEVQYLTSWLQLRIAYLDSEFNGKAATTTALSMPSGTLRSGTAATFSAQVTGTTTPTGTVTFLSNNALLGTATLNGTGGASLTTSNLPAGTDSIEAVYNGDSVNRLSASAAQSATVLGPLVNSVTSLVSSNTAVTEDGSAASTVTFSVSVVGNSGTGTPSGTITFSANGNPIGTANLMGGVATFPTMNLPGGSDSIQAAYGGDDSFAGSASNAVTVQVTQTATPQLSVAAGTYASAQTVTLTDSTSGAVIYYTTNGTTPTTSSAVYSGAITVSATETIEAIAVAPNFTDSAVVSAVYTISVAAATSQFSVGAGTYASAQMVTLTDSTTGAAIYYTTNGSTPTTSSMRYSGAIPVNATETIEAIAVAANYSDSAVASAVFTITPAFTLSITPPTASISSGQSASFTLTVTPEHDFTQPISFACSGLPSGETCSFSPATIMPASTPVSTLTISGTQQTASGRSDDLFRWTRLGGGAALALLVFWPVRRRRRPLVALIVLLGIGLTLSGCGTNAHSSVALVTVTATGGGVTQSQVVNLSISK